MTVHRSVPVNIIIRKYASFIDQTQCRDFVTDQCPENYLLKCSYTTRSSKSSLQCSTAHTQQEAPNVQQEKTQKDWSLFWRLYCLDLQWNTYMYMCRFQVEKGPLCNSNFAKVVHFTVSCFNHFIWFHWETRYCWNPNWQFLNCFMQCVKYFNFCGSLKICNSAKMLLHKGPLSTWILTYIFHTF